MDRRSALKEESIRYNQSSIIHLMVPKKPCGTSSRLLVIVCPMVNVELGWGFPLSALGKQVPGTLYRDF